MYEGRDMKYQIFMIFKKLKQEVQLNTYQTQIEE